MPISRQPSTENPSFNYKEVIGFVQLYIPDVDMILKMMREGAEGVKFKADGAYLDNANELKDLTRKELQNVTITSVEPPVVVNLTSLYCFVSTSKDHHEARALVREVADVMRNTYQVHPFVASLRHTFPLAFVALFLLIVGSWPGIPFEARIPLLTFAFFMLVMIWGFGWTQLRAGRTWITPSTRAEARIANRSVLAVIASAFLSSVVTGIVTWAVTIATVNAG